MKTIILPGFSLKNKDWAYAAKYNLPEIEIMVHEWFHWITESDSDFSIEQEVSRLNIKEPINIIAKSIGTLIVVNMLKQNKENKINKIIFNGIPLNDLKEEDFEVYKVLKDFDLDKTLFIQNEEDIHGNHKEVSEFLKKINPKVKVISKPGDTHEYPYWDEFRDFLQK